MIDTHAHLFLCKRPLEELVTNAKNAGLTQIINVGLNKQTSVDAQAQARLYPDFIFPTAGLYPGHEKDEEFFREIEQWVIEKRIVAIGEIGLDYFRVTAPRAQQIETFEIQLGIAERTNASVIVHNRHADDDVISICKNFPKVKKVFHCFGSSPATIDKLMDESTYFSFTATITFENTGKAINGLRHIPLGRLMIETDCPYLTPRVFGKVENQPAHVIKVAERISELKEVSVETVITTTTDTAKQFFNTEL